MVWAILPCVTTTVICFALSLDFTLLLQLLGENIIIFILQMRKLKLRLGSQNYTAEVWVVFLFLFFPSSKSCLLYYVVFKAFIKDALYK